MPGWFRKALDKGEKFIIEVADELNDESQVHKAANRLCLRVEQILNANRAKLERQVIDAAENFLRDLRIALDEDSQLRYPHAPINQYILVDKCTNIIHKYKPSLESAPGFWNQLKAHINNFIEMVFGIEDVFSTKPTMFSKDVDFIKCQRNLSALKESLEYNALNSSAVSVSS
ncbi:hypothetical protein EP47_11645 [Legionella norrlandica]|uniref:Uncharacterized protein n=1 Tax=Legionella norrlandica TaxID=1498499 RepID=A0A0A2SYD9_9GAMM|nr:hypothetical protein [Legionella norrlandica]KGP64414.1 hypothetical protein EP47_11645 [Legionella norrlandica]